MNISLSRYWLLLLMLIINIGRGKRNPWRLWWRTNPDWVENPTKKSTGNYVDMDVTVQSVCLYVSTCLCVSLVGQLINTPTNEVWGMFFSPCLSVCLSVCPFVHPSVHLSPSVCLFVCLSPVCGHDSKRWVHEFLWKFVYWLLTIIDVHLEFSYFSILQALW